MQQSNGLHSSSNEERVGSCPEPQGGEDGATTTTFPPIESPSRRAKKKVKSVTAGMTRPVGWDKVTAAEYALYESEALLDSTNSPVGARQFPDIKTALNAMSLVDRLDQETESTSPILQQPTGNDSQQPGSPLRADNTRSNSLMGSQTMGSGTPSADRAELILIHQQRQANAAVAHNTKKRKVKSVTSAVVNRVGVGSLPFSAPPPLPPTDGSVNQVSDDTETMLGIGGVTTPGGNMSIVTKSTSSGYESMPTTASNGGGKGGGSSNVRRVPSPTDSTPSRRSGDRPSCILDFLWLGGVDGAKDEAFLRKHNITSIINISTEDYTLHGSTVIHEELQDEDGNMLPPCTTHNPSLPTSHPHTSRITVHKFPAQDSADFPIQRYFARCFEILDEVRKSYYDSLLTLDKRSDKSLRYLTHNDRIRSAAPTWGSMANNSEGANAAPPSSMVRQGSALSDGAAHDTSPVDSCETSKRGAGGITTHDSARVLYSNLRRVLVHCQKGRSRSATVVAAYIMKCNGWTATDTLQYVAGLRPVIEPNLGFLFRLRDVGRTMSLEYRTQRLRELTLVVRGVHPSWLERGGRRLRSRLTIEVGRVSKLEERPNSSPTLVAVYFSSSECTRRALNLYKYHPRRFYPLYYPYAPDVKEADKPVTADGEPPVVELFRKPRVLHSSGVSTPPIATCGTTD